MLDRVYPTLSQVQARVERVENVTPIKIVPVQEGLLIDTPPPMIMNLPDTLPNLNDLSIGTRAPVVPRPMDMMNVVASPQRMDARPWPTLYHELASEDLDMVNASQAIRDYGREGTQYRLRVQTQGGMGVGPWATPPAQVNFDPHAVAREICESLEATMGLHHREV